MIFLRVPADLDCAGRDFFRRGIIYGAAFD